MPFRAGYDAAMGVLDRSHDLGRPFVVACDWNGTLVDDGDRAWQAAHVVLGRMGLEAPGRADFFARWRLPLGSLFAAFGVPNAQLEGAVRDWNAELGAREAGLARGATEMIEAIRSLGGGVGVVSAAAVDIVRRETSRFGLTGMLDFVVGDADPKHTALRAIRPDRPAEVIYVGDTEYDVIEARVAGVWAVGYGGGYRPSSALLAAGADHVIDRLEDLPALVGRLGESAPRRSGAPR